MISGRKPQGAGGHWLNEQRVRAYSLITIIVFSLVGIVWVTLALPGLVDLRGKPVGYDFIAFWSAARLAVLGKPAAAFDWGALAAMHHLAVPGMRHLLYPWHYPPTFLLALLPLGWLAYGMALTVFTLVSVIFWFALTRRLVVHRHDWVIAAAAPAGLVCVMDGQNAFLTASLAGLALLSLDRRPVRAGLLIGALAIKPHLAVLFPLALIAAGRWRCFAVAAATVVLFTGASVTVFGWDTMAAFIRDLQATPAIADHGQVPWGAMPSAYVFARSLGAVSSVATVLQVGVALLAGTCVWRVWRHATAPFEAKAATLLAASLLVSPYLFNYDMTWSTLAVAWMARLAARTGFQRGEREILLGVWIAPLVMIPIQSITGIQIGFPLLLLLLLVAADRATRRVVPRPVGHDINPIADGYLDA